jgi:hypothetical protein
VGLVPAALVVFEEEGDVVSACTDRQMPRERRLDLILEPDSALGDG